MTRDELVAQAAQDLGADPKLVDAIVSRATAYAWEHPSAKHAQLANLVRGLVHEAGYEDCVDHPARVTPGKATASEVAACRTVPPSVQPCARLCTTWRKVLREALS